VEIHGIGGFGGVEELEIGRATREMKSFVGIIPRMSGELELWVSMKIAL